MATIHSTERIQDSKGFLATMKRCPFDITGIQLLENSPKPVVSWAKDNNLHIYKRRMNKDVYGNYAIFKIYESMIKQSDCIVYIGAPKSKLDNFIVSKAWGDGKHIWMAS